MVSRNFKIVVSLIIELLFIVLLKDLEFYF